MEYIHKQISKCLYKTLQFVDYNISTLLHTTSNSFLLHHPGGALFRETAA